MRFVRPLEISQVDIFDAISLAKNPPRRGHMVAARPQVLEAYTAYQEAVPEVGQLALSNLTEDQKEAMHHAYAVATKPMTSLRTELLKRVIVSRCPFCSINESSTLDHYLPKENYPEFSVLPNNLVPSCPACNTKKRDLILERDTNVRMFLHPYFDSIPELPFLDVQIRVALNALIMSYSIFQPQGMPPETFQHISAHFRELDLANRYRIMGLEHLGDQYPALSRVYGVNHDSARVVEKLLEISDDIHFMRGPNYWLAKMYKALAENQEFCDGGFEVLRPAM